MKPDGKDSKGLVRSIFQRKEDSVKTVPALFAPPKVQKAPPAAAPKSKAKKPVKKRRGDLPAVAIEIDHDGICLVQAEKAAASKEQVIAVIDREPFGSYQADPSEAEVRDTLARLLARNSVGHKAVGTVFVRAAKMYNLVFPPMAADELKSAIQWKIEQFDPFGGPIEDVVYNYAVWRSMDFSEDQMFVTLFCVPKKEIEQKKNLFRQLGIPLVGLEVRPMGLLYFYGKSVPALDNDVTMWIEFGQRESSLVISVRGIPATCKPLAFGLENIRQQIEQRLQVPAQQAEDVMLRVGLKAKFETVPAEVERRISLGLLTLFEGLIVEVGHGFKTFSYDFQQSGITRLDRIVLCGDGSAIPGLDKFLHEGLGVEVRRLDPMEGLKFAVTEMECPAPGPRLVQAASVAIGMAAGYGEGNRRTFNLLGDGKFQDRVSSAARGPWFQLAAVGMVLMIGFTVVLARQLMSTGLERGRLEAKLKASKKSLATYQQDKLDSSKSESVVLEESKSLEARLRILDSAKRSPKNFAATLAEFVQYLPEKVWLDEFSYSAGEMILAGKATDTQDVLVFIENLKRSANFRDIAFRQARKEKEGGGYSFEIGARSAP